MGTGIGAVRGGTLLSRIDGGSSKAEHPWPEHAHGLRRTKEAWVKVNNFYLHVRVGIDESALNGRACSSQPILEKIFLI